MLAVTVNINTNPLVQSNNYRIFCHKAQPWSPLTLAGNLITTTYCEFLFFLNGQFLVPM